jgi:hypothetical protein
MLSPNPNVLKISCLEGGPCPWFRAIVVRALAGSLEKKCPCRVAVVLARAPGASRGVRFEEQRCYHASGRHTVGERLNRARTEISFPRFPTTNGSWPCTADAAVHV